MSRNRHAVLPTGEKVRVLEPANGSGYTHKHIGYIDPRMLAPYAEQPRTYIDPRKLAELKESIKNTGVRDNIIVTPLPKALALGATVESGDEELPFMIVSGHRRRRSAVEAELEAVPIEIRLYDSKSELDDDAGILNDNRENLSEIEEGYRFRQRIEEGGEKITHIVAATGKAFQHIQGRIALTYLAEDIQALISPELTSRDRMAIGFASALGALKLPETLEALQDKLEELGDVLTDPESLSEDEQRFALQRAYLAYCRKQGWKGVESEAFVRHGRRPDKMGKLRSGGATNRHSGNLHGNTAHSIESLRNMHPREALIAWCELVCKTGFTELRPAELRRAFEYAIREDLYALADVLEIAQQEVAGMAELLRKLAGEKPVTRPEVLAHASKRKEAKLLHSLNR